ncbi:helix-turn-helix transcriptional regulator [Aureisphaera galaxeae]|uniref:helix-turn-helix domain-containing protein n=1 Tax=Aureisphaera galaxeae TaxID=1538023 RepID=UPI0023505A60|nr:helix-turn-helix transcriptional regulator [Aureisphaera galaxeae]MDC8004552.1 helix-turn-helix transcriptional regulator [Aureisphaera galaxeae]
MIQLTAIQLITLLAVFNGLIFSLLILDKKENKVANRFLALLIVSMCFSFTPYVLENMVWYKYRWLVWLPLSLSYWIGPSFYFYVKALTQEFKFQKKHLWYFSPIILNFVHSTYHFFYQEGNPFPYFHKFTELLESLAIIIIFIFTLLSYRLLVRYAAKLYNQYSNVEKITLSWLKNLAVVVMSAFAMVAAYLIISGSFLGKKNLDYWNTYKFICIVVYILMLQWLVIKGYKQAPTAPLFINVSNEPEIKETSSVIVQLQKIIVEKHLYRNPELTLADLSKSVGLSERTISAAINNELNKNFYRFINEYRVEEVKAKLRDPKFDHMKILSIALDSGFNSKASFNRIFKSYVGQTPLQFKSSKS